MRKIKCIIKRPDEEYGHMTAISTTLENLQKTVGGYIETVPLTCGVIAIVNEEGKIKGLERNLRIPGDVLCGTIILIGTKGEDLDDIPISFKAWKQYVNTCKEFIY
jgi:hypothetical protein